MNEELLPIGITENAETPRTVAKPRKERRLGAVVGLVLLVTLCGASIWKSIGWRDALTVHRIVIEGNRVIPAEEIVKLTNITSETKTYSVDLKKMRALILTQHFIGSVSITRRAPDAIHVRLEERQPIAMVSQRDVRFLDADGVALPPYHRSLLFDVPLITGTTKAGDFSPGRRTTNPQILYALSLLKHAHDMDPDLYHLISEVHIDEHGDAILYSADAGVPILFGTQNESRKLGMLRAFWNTFVPQRGAQNLKLVDVRYDDQVIVRWTHNANDAL